MEDDGGFGRAWGSGRKEMGVALECKRPPVQNSRKNGMKEGKANSMKGGRRINLIQCNTLFQHGEASMDIFCHVLSCAAGRSAWGHRIRLTGLKSSPRVPAFRDLR